MERTVSDFVRNSTYKNVKSLLTKLTQLKEDAERLTACGAYKDGSQKDVYDEIARSLYRLGNDCRDIENGWSRWDIEDSVQKVMFPIIALEDRMRYLEPTFRNLEEKRDMGQSLSLLCAGRFPADPAGGSRRWGSRLRPLEYGKTVSKIRSHSQRINRKVKAMKEKYKDSIDPDENWHLAALAATRLESLGVSDIFDALAHNIKGKEEQWNTMRTQKTPSDPESRGHELSPNGLGMSAEGVSQHLGGTAEEADRVLQQLQGLGKTATDLGSLARTMVWTCTTKDPKDYLEQRHDFDTALEKFTCRPSDAHEATEEYRIHLNHHMPRIKDWLERVQYVHTASRGWKGRLATHVSLQG